jgi:hypothetical protein
MERRLSFEGLDDTWRSKPHYVISAVGDNIYSSRDGVPVGILDFPTFEIAEHFVEIIKKERARLEI